MQPQEPNVNMPPNYGVVGFPGEDFAITYELLAREGDHVRYKAWQRGKEIQPTKAIDALVLADLAKKESKA